MRRQKAGFFDHALMAAVVGFVIGALWVADAYSQSYTTFPNLQSGNVNFTATIRANGSACASGTAIVSGGGTVTCTAVVPTSQKGAANGVASLDGSGKVPTSQLPFSGLTYDGSWNATTNSPTLADGTGTSGHFYITSVAGTQNLGSGSITFAVGDWALYNGTVWQKVPSSAAVSSVFGRTGAVTATAGDYTATQVTNTPAGGIAATTAQAAINELDTEKQAAASTLTSWAALTRASGFDTFTQTPSSANLRGLLTDETGTGLAYFQGGALGTPSSGTLTSATGLPWSTGLTGVPTTAAGYGITGGAKLDAYAGGDTPSAFTLGIVDSVDAAAWRAAIGAGTSSATGTVTSVSGSGGSTGLTLTGGPITTTGTLTLGGTLADGSLSSNVALKNAANIFTADQTITKSSAAFAANSTSASPRLELQSSGVRKAFVSGSLATNDFCNGTSAGDLCLGAAAGGIAFTTNDGGSLAGKVSSTGNWVLNAPSSGTTLSVTPFAGSTGISVSGDNGSGSGLSLTNTSASDGRSVVDFVATRTSSKNYTLGIDPDGSASKSFSLRDVTRGAIPFSVSTTGNVTIAAPSSGATLTVAAASSWAAWASASASNSYMSFANAATRGYIGTDGGAIIGSGTGTNFGIRAENDLFLMAGAANRVTVNSAGNVTVNAPSSSSAFVVNGAADGGGGTTWTSELIGSSSSGHSFGLRVRAGTTSGDSALRVMDASNSNLYLDVAGNGGVQIGAPVGGNPGAGGINVSGALQKNGVNACLSDGTNCPGSGSSGTWTATCTASTNVSSCTPNVGQYMRVGNIVTWSMSSSITCTSASVDTITYFSLPVASALTSTYQVAGVVGTAAGDLAMQSSGAVAADATNDRFDVRYVCGSNAGFPYIYYMSGTYQVL